MLSELSFFVVYFTKALTCMKYSQKAVYTVKDLLTDYSFKLPGEEYWFATVALTKMKTTIFLKILINYSVSHL